MTKLEYDPNIIDVLNNNKRVKIYLHAVLFGYKNIGDLVKATSSNYRTVKNVLNAVKTGVFTPLYKV